MVCLQKGCLKKKKKCCLCLYDSRWLTATPKIYPMGRRRGRKDPPPQCKTQKLFLSLLLLPGQSDLIMWSYQLQGAWKGSWTIMDPAKNFTGIEYSLHPFSPRKPSVMMEITKRAEPRNSQRNETRPNLTYSLPLSFSVAWAITFYVKICLIWGFSYLQPKAICFSTIQYFPNQKVRI